MIVFVSISAVCTGLFVGGIAGCLGVPEWVAALIAGLISGGMTLALFKWMRNERNSERELQRMFAKKVNAFYEGMLEDKHAEIEACCRDLKKADIDCQFCKHSNDPELGKKCLDSDCSCEECGADCPCRVCRSNSNYKWRGVCDDNDVEE